MSVYCFHEPAPRIGFVAAGIADESGAKQRSHCYYEVGNGVLGGCHKFYIPEVIDYELRRELLRAGKTAGIAKLDLYKATFRYLPITSETMLLAADMWAQVRRLGQPTSDPKHLDIDVILAAQAITSNIDPANLVVVTSNVGHLSRFVTADLWTNIVP